MAVVTSLTSLVSPEELRSLLGVNRKELPETVVALPVHFRSVQVATDKVDKRLWPLFESLPDPLTTDEERLFHRNFLHFIAYQSARIIGGSLQQFSPRSVTDGKAAFQRHLDSPKNTLKEIEAALGDAINALVEAAAPLLPAVETPTVVVPMRRASFGASDPVTG